jgi:hypothetical protein
MSQSLTADADIPAGNVVVEEVEGDDIHIRPDLRDTAGDWFYWHFRVRNAGGRSLRVHLTRPNTFAGAGPAASLDRGKTWQWIGAEACDEWTFGYEVPGNAADVRFSMGMPYTERNFAALVREFADNPNVMTESLCTSRQGRAVEALRLGRLRGGASRRVLLTARHHCCEMMASYVLDGFIRAVLEEDSPTGRWYRDHVEILAIPFADKDGVENGDQGKNRRPRDHNRDYEGAAIYPETAAIREAVPAWAAETLQVALDLHCPCLRGSANERIYLVGSIDDRIWREQCRFGEILEATRAGPLPYAAADNLPFGTGWNRAENFAQGKSCARWTGEIPGIRLATTIEIPYAVVRDQSVTPASAGAFGADLATALARYLKT